MPITAAALRLEIESTLSRRIPGALSPRLRPETELFPSGIKAVDRLIQGGFPRGAVSEIIGLASTGRTSLALSAVAGLTQKGAACAWVDVDDTLDPESAAACGVVLERLLWVRAGDSADQSVSPPRTKPRVAAVKPEPAATHGNILHPRHEVRNLDRAVSQLFSGEGGLLRDKRIGTPGMPNRPLTDFTPRCSEPLPHRRKQEQVPLDRLPARRGEAMLKPRIEPENDYSPQSAWKNRTAADPERFARREKKPWPRIEQALKATDLLLQTGGFSLVVLDMGDQLAENASRVPLATWYRFRLGAEQAQAALILLAQTSCARSCSSLVLECQRAMERQRWSAGEEIALLEGIEYRVAVDRNRREAPGKKPAGRVTWSSAAQWIR